jgi:hypothetical protein
MEDLVLMQTQLDAYRAAREIRLENQRKVDQLKEKETAMQHSLISFLSSHPELNGLIGSTHKAILKQNNVPIIENIDDLKRYIVENDAWDLVSLRLSPPAVRERWEDNLEVPGVSSLVETKLSITKL